MINCKQERAKLQYIITHSFDNTEIQFYIFALI